MVASVGLRPRVEAAFVVRSPSALPEEDRGAPPPASTSSAAAAAAAATSLPEGRRSPPSDRDAAARAASVSGATSGAASTSVPSSSLPSESGPSGVGAGLAAAAALRAVGGFPGSAARLDGGSAPAPAAGALSASRPLPARSAPAGPPAAFAFSDRSRTVPAQQENVSPTGLAAPLRSGSFGSLGKSRGLGLGSAGSLSDGLVALHESNGNASARSLDEDAVSAGIRAADAEQGGPAPAQLGAAGKGAGAGARSGHPDERSGATGKGPGSVAASGSLGAGSLEASPSPRSPRVAADGPAAAAGRPRAVYVPPRILRATVPPDWGDSSPDERPAVSGSFKDRVAGEGRVGLALGASLGARSASPASFFDAPRARSGTPDGEGDAGRDAAARRDTGGGSAGGDEGAAANAPSASARFVGFAPSPASTPTPEVSASAAPSSPGSPSAPPSVVLLPQRPESLSSGASALVAAAARGLAAGYAPDPLREGMGGTYLLCDDRGRPRGLLKPCDEEPLAPNNPKGYVGRKLGDPGFKPAVRVGEAAVREVAAYLLDGGFAGVPHTASVVAAHPRLHRAGTGGVKGGGFDRPAGAVGFDARGGDREPPSTRSAHPLPSAPPAPSASAPLLKRASLQEFVPHEASCGDVGCSGFPTKDVQRIAILDLRLFNTDRHSGNILVVREVPGQGRDGDDADEAAAAAAAAAARDDPPRAPRALAAGDAGTDPAASSASSSPSPSPPRYSAPSFLARSPATPRLPGRRGERALRLVPIDHGFALPESLEPPYFEWQHWPQAALPLGRAELAYVESLDAKRDVAMLRRELPSIRESSLRLLEVCTELLKSCVRSGMSLADVAAVVTRPLVGLDDEPSDLEVLCDLCRRDALAASHRLAALGPAPTLREEDEDDEDDEVEEGRDSGLSDRERAASSRPPSSALDDRDVDSLWGDEPHAEPLSRLRGAVSPAAVGAGSPLHPGKAPASSRRALDPSPPHTPGAAPAPARSTDCDDEAKAETEEEADEGRSASRTSSRPVSRFASGAGGRPSRAASPSGSEAEPSLQLGDLGSARASLSDEGELDGRCRACIDDEDDDEAGEYDDEDDEDDEDEASLCATILGSPFPSRTPGPGSWKSQATFGGSRPGSVRVGVSDSRPGSVRLALGDGGRDGRSAGAGAALGSGRSASLAPGVPFQDTDEELEAELRRDLERDRRERDAAPAATVSSPATEGPLALARPLPTAEPLPAAGRSLDAEPLPAPPGAPNSPAVSVPTSPGTSVQSCSVSSATLPSSSRPSPSPALSAAAGRATAGLAAVLRPRSRLAASTRAPTSDDEDGDAEGRDAEGGSARDARGADAAEDVASAGAKVAAGDSAAPAPAAASPSPAAPAPSPALVPVPPAQQQASSSRHDDGLFFAIDDLQKGSGGAAASPLKPAPPAASRTPFASAPVPSAAASSLPRAGASNWTPIPRRPKSAAAVLAPPPHAQPRASYAAVASSPARGAAVRAQPSRVTGFVTRTANSAASAASEGSLEKAPSCLLPASSSEAQSPPSGPSPPASGSGAAPKPDSLGPVRAPWRRVQVSWQRTRHDATMAEPGSSVGTALLRMRRDSRRYPMAFGMGLARDYGAKGSSRAGFGVGEGWSREPDRRPDGPAGHRAVGTGPAWVEKTPKADLVGLGAPGTGSGSRATAGPFAAASFRTGPPAASPAAAGTLRTPGASALAAASGSGALTASALRAGPANSPALLGAAGAVQAPSPASLQSLSSLQRSSRADESDHWRRPASPPGGRFRPRPLVAREEALSGSGGSWRASPVKGPWAARAAREAGERLEDGFEPGERFGAEGLAPSGQPLASSALPSKITRVGFAPPPVSTSSRPSSGAEKKRVEGFEVAAPRPASAPVVEVPSSAPAAARAPGASTPLSAASSVSAALGGIVKSSSLAQGLSLSQPPSLGVLAGAAGGPDAAVIPRVKSALGMVIGQERERARVREAAEAADGPGAAPERSPPSATPSPARSASASPDAALKGLSVARTDSVLAADPSPRTLARTLSSLEPAPVAAAGERGVPPFGDLTEAQWEAFMAVFQRRVRDALRSGRWRRLSSSFSVPGTSCPRF